MTKPRSPTTWERFNNWLDDMDRKISNHFFIPKYGYIIAFACVVKILYNAVSIGLLAYQKHHNDLLTDQGHVLVRWAIIQSAVLMVWLFYMFFFTTCWRYLEDMLQDMGPFGWKDRRSPGANSYNYTNGRWKGARSLNVRYVKEKEFSSNWSDTPSEQRAWVAYSFEALSPDAQSAAHQTAWLRKELLARVGSFKKREYSFTRNTLLDNQDGTVWDHGVVDVVAEVVELHQIPNINDHINDNDCAAPEQEEQHEEAADHEEEEEEQQQQEHVVVEVSTTSTTHDPRPNPFETPPEPSHLSELGNHTILHPSAKMSKEQTKNTTPTTKSKNSTPSPV